MWHYIIIGMIIYSISVGQTVADQLNKSLVDIDSIDFKHLSLQQAETLLLTNNREIQLARRAIEAAQADLVTTAQRPNPNLSVSTSKLSNHMGAGNVWNKQSDTVVQLSQLYERGNKRELRKDVSELKIKSSQSGFADVVRQQYLALDAAYYNLLLLQEKSRIAQENVTFYKTALGAAELRLKAGDISPADLARMQVDTMRAHNDLQQVMADLQKAQLSLAYLLGKNAIATEITVSDQWPVAENVIIDMTKIEELVMQRPDVKAAQLTAEAARKNRELARSLRTRDITFSAQYEHAPPDSPNSFGIGISIPLFTNYYYEGEIQRAEADLAAAEDEVVRVIAQARTEISKNLVDLQSAAARVHQFRDSLLAQAHTAAKAAEFAYKHGAINVTDLLDARRTLRATEFEAISAQADFATTLKTWQSSMYVPKYQE